MMATWPASGKRDVESGLLDRVRLRRDVVVRLSAVLLRRAERDTQTGPAPPDASPASGRTAGKGRGPDGAFTSRTPSELG